ncbi:MAG: glycosyltransferase, partial [Flavitalea sp.]
MISICIPVFNTNILLLVRQLSVQAANAAIPVEIVVVDDGSSPAIQNINKDISSIESVIYKFQPSNTGRIKSRMALSGFAKYPWLLFMDDDSKIIKEDFLAAYFQQLSDPERIVTGGRKYSETPPADCNYRLHWKYGKNREHHWRNIAGNWEGFQSNNFLIHKTVFDSISFPEELTGYGHEDTWMGIQLGE